MASLGSVLGGYAIRQEREEPEPSQYEVQRHNSLYYDNGDVVLFSLPKDNIITAFKVDKVFLSRHSPVFAGMFSMPSPETMDIYDGVPFAHVHDEAEHLFSFLHALYDVTSLPIKRLRHNTITQFEGILKLSNKYEVEPLHDRAVEILSADWPNDLSSWDANEKEMSVIVSEYLSSGVDCTLDDFSPEPCSAIRLAREYDIPGILPAAFYHLSRIPPFADLKKPSSFRDEEAEDRYEDYMTQLGRRADFGLLSRHDLICLMKGTYDIAFFVQESFSGIVKSTTEDCTSEEPHCRKALDTLMAVYEREAVASRDPLQLLQGQGFSAPKGLCSDCEFHFTHMIYNFRGQLWRRLPKLFEL